MAVTRAATAADVSVTQTGSQVQSDKTNTLGKDDFLKLMVTKLRYNNSLMGGQDSGDSEFITQMAQFTSLEQMENLNSTMTQMASLQALNQGASLLGRDVEARVPGSDAPVTGKVTAVEYDGKSPVLVVGDQRISVADVIKVA